MKRFFLSMIGLLIFGISTSLAQDTDDLQNALKKLDGVSTCFHGQISQEQPEGNGLGGLLGGGGAIQIEIGGIGQIGGDAESFEGELEIYVAEDGSVASASTGGFPEVKIYSDGDNHLFRQTHDGKSTNIKGIGELLDVTTNFQSLVKELDEVKVRSESTSDGWKYRATIDGEFFEPDMGQGNQVLQIISDINAKIVEGVLEVVVDNEGNIRTMSYELLYNDPMGAMIEDAMENGGGAQIQGLGDLADAADSEGKTVTIEFRFDGAPCELAKAFSKEARELLK